MCRHPRDRNVLTPSFPTRRSSDLIGGRSVAEVLPEGAEQGFVALLDRVFVAGEAYRGHSVPVRLARDGGEERLLDFVYQPIRDARGEVSGIFVEATDSTERARAEAALRESEERLKLALESSRMIGGWDWDVPAA